MKHSSRQFGDKFPGFGRQSEKFSCIGAISRPDIDSHGLIEDSNIPFCSFFMCIAAVAFLIC